MDNLVALESEKDIYVDLSDNTLAVLGVASTITGLLYVTLFGGSVAFQVFVNYRAKSAIGYSCDYSLINLVGFYFLLFNQIIGMIDPWSDAGRVNDLDMSFAVIAFVCASAAYSQTFIYPAVPSMDSTRMVTGALMSFFFLAAYLECYRAIPMKSYTGVSLIDFAAFLKAGSSLIKYIYQIYENAKNKSTQGLSALAYQTDFLGTVFCFAQLQIDSLIAGYKNFMVDPQMNLAKVLLSCFGLINTSIILLQIHCIYNANQNTLDSIQEEL